MLLKCFWSILLLRQKIITFLFQFGFLLVTITIIITIIVTWLAFVIELRSVKHLIAEFNLKPQDNC